MSPSERAAVDQAHRQFGEPTATPKPRAGEHISTPTRAVIVLESLAAQRGKSFRQNRKSSDAEEALLELREWLFKVGARKETISELQAERDLLIERETRLLHMMRKSGAFTENDIQAALAKHGR